MKFYFKIIVIIIITLPNFLLAIKTNNICRFMLENKKTENKCKLKSYNFYRQKRLQCVFSDMNVEMKLTNSSLQKILSENRNEMVFDVYFKNKRPLILDKQLQIFDQNLFNLRIRSDIRFRFLKGFDVDSFNFTLTNNEAFSGDGFYWFHYIDSSIAFYKNGKLLKSCAEFSSQPRSIFQVFHHENLNILILNSNFKIMCPLAFSNSYIYRLFLFHLIDSFYKTNILKFFDLPKNISHINATLKYVRFCGYGGITLNPRVINRHMFNQTIEFRFYLEISAIEKETFAPYRNTYISLSELTQLINKCDFTQR